MIGQNHKNTFAIRQWCHKVPFVSAKHTQERKIKTPGWEIRPHCGFVPTNKKDIEDYFSCKRTKSKSKPDDKRVVFETDRETLCQFVHLHTLS